MPERSGLAALDLRPPRIVDARSNDSDLVARAVRQHVGPRQPLALTPNRRPFACRSRRREAEAAGSVPLRRRSRSASPSPDAGESRPSQARRRPRSGRLLLGERRSRRNLLGRRRRANDGVAVHMHARGTAPAESLVRDCRFLSQTRRLGDATSSTAGCRPTRQPARRSVALPQRRAETEVSGALMATLSVFSQSSSDGLRCSFSIKPPLCCRWRGGGDFDGQLRAAGQLARAGGARFAWTVSVSEPERRAEAASALAYGPESLIFVEATIELRDARAAPGGGQCSAGPRRSCVDCRRV
jgi:hypothetical protein